MQFIARSSTQPRATLPTATILLTVYAGVTSAHPWWSKAGPSRRASTRRITALPEGALIVTWLADYAVLRDQAQACVVSQPVPCWRRERAMLRFRRIRSLQKFASDHASVCNHFNADRRFSRSRLLKANRAAALAEWRGLGIA